MDTGITFDNVYALNSHLNYAIHDIMSCVGKVACLDIIIDLASIQSDLYFIGRSQLYVHNAHCDKTNQMKDYCFMVTFYTSNVSKYDAHVTITIDWMDENEPTLSEDAKRCKSDYKELVKHINLQYGNLVY